jgi:hypothetical protein
MARHPAIGTGAATRVLSPDAMESAERIRELVSEFSTARRPGEEVTVVPGRWVMIATSAATSLSAGAQALTTFGDGAITSRATRSLNTGNVAVRNLSSFCVSTHCAEAAVVVGRGHRSGAGAARLR